MDRFLTSYSITEKGIQLSVGKVYGILSICKKCKKYECGKCGCGQDGVRICKRGCAVYERQGVVYFGLHLKDSYKPSRALRFDAPCVLKYQQFQVLQDYDQQLNSFEFAQGQALVFSSDYDKYVENIEAALPDPRSEGWTKDVKGKTICRQNIVQAIEALTSLIDKRRRFSELFSKPGFQNILPFFSMNVANDSLIAPDARCLRCRNHECNCGNNGFGLDRDFLRCSKGVFFIRGFGRTYYGLHIIENEDKKRWSRRDKKKNCMMFSKSRLYDLLNFVSTCEYEICIARRFLHDAGQFLSAIQNLLPYTDANRNQNAFFRASSLISINAMTTALKCLKRQLFGSVRRKGRHHQFSPYQLFDKYRYCFSESARRVNLIKADGQDFYELVTACEGFEFAVLNLLSNAIKYLPPDERFNTVDIKFNHIKKGIEIEVESMGVKVNESDLPKLGTRWFRGRNALDSGVKGEGLGLYAVVSCMRQSGFSIKFSSSGAVEHINDIDYRKFSARIRIPQCYIVDKVE